MPIEQMAPELEDIIDLNAEIKELGSGYGGDNGPAEGPLWWHEGNYLLFSDIHNNRRMKWAEGEGVTLFSEPTNRANGLTRDLQGHLLAAEHDGRRVSRLSGDGERITVVANSFQGRQLNRPNDVIVKSDGSIYFTDPWTFPPGSQSVGADHFGRIPGLSRSWHPHFAGGRLHPAQRPGLLPGRKCPVRQRLPATAHPGL